jgi:hypothetical protein
MLLSEEELNMMNNNSLFRPGGSAKGSQATHLGQTFDTDGVRLPVLSAFRMFCPGMHSEESDTASCCGTTIDFPMGLLIVNGERFVLTPREKRFLSHRPSV